MVQLAKEEESRRASAEPNDHRIILDLGSLAPATPQSRRVRVPFGAAYRRPLFKDPLGGAEIKLESAMSKIAQAIVDQTGRYFPIALVGFGLIVTILWTSAVMALALASIWSVVPSIS